MTRKTWEDQYHRANALLFENRFEEACGTLRDAKKEYDNSGEREIAAFYSNVLGSFYSSKGQLEAALDAYREAERLDPENPNWRLSTANLLLATPENAEQAHSIANEVVQTVQDDLPLLHSALSTLGLALCQLDRRAEAISAFERMREEESVRLLPLSSCDLRLARTLLAMRIASERCRSYLRQLLERAARDGNQAIESEIRTILSEADISSPG